MLIPCLSCGELSPNSRCAECTKVHNRAVARANPARGSRARGYNHAWDVLSRRARKLQPFCSRCGSPDDLQCDHTPRAWLRKEQGLPIRLKDVDVLCGECNRLAGEARPGSPRAVRELGRSVSKHK